MAYPFNEIEKKWQNYWRDHKTFRAVNPSPNGGGKEGAPKYYALDMFPYPSGAGLHVGHPLGYIASDIVARYKRLKGFNVLHPMGYDSFGLPAEQYAIQTGQHPEKTTKENIARYRSQMDKIGFSFDWDREVQTSDPNYYKWTQWIFLKLFNSWYNPEIDKAESLDTLIPKLKNFSSLSEKEKSDLLMNYRLAYLSEAWVNWCPQMGTVLANEEVKDGVSERGGYPVERKLMPQWSLRITAYAERLLNDLEKIEWSESIKESQRNWIGKSEGSSLKFKVESSKLEIEVFTTRPDTVFGATFLTLAPESDLVAQLTAQEQKQKVQEYVHYAKNRSERERQSEVKKVTGEFTGSFAIHPFTGKQIPIWIGDYVLAGYGTGAVMGVPAHDSRDHAFAKHFGLPIVQVIQPPANSSPDGGGQDGASSYDAKEGKCINSDFLNGLDVKDSIKRAIKEIEAKGLGKGKTQFRLRDAIFGRQRYWGEPIPIYYDNGIPKAVEEKELPVVLPEVDKYLPTEDGEPPLARAKNWRYQGKYEYEKTTMPGWAGSSWYYLRYMDSQNKNEFASKDAINYWRDVDLYIGGSEHATGHLLYVRFWTKFLFDLNLIPIIEPAKKLINQGMIQGRSNTIFRFFDTDLYISNALMDEWGACVAERFQNTNNRFTKYFIDKLGVEYFEKNIKSKLTTSIAASQFYIDVNIVKNDVLNQDAFRKSRKENTDAIFLTGEDGQYYCGVIENEKMSKSKLNVVTPDDICTKFGADTLRLYEMFLGPLEMSKPWNTNGISGVFNFLNRFWRLFHKENPTKNPEEKLQNPEFWEVSDEEPTNAELKILHKTIKKIQDDIENYSFNTSVSAFMICTNELMEIKCDKKKILEPLVILLSPFAPHIAEELWNKLGHKESISFAEFPKYNDAFTVDDSFAYPVSFNGKMRFNLELSLSLTAAEIEKEVMACEQTNKYLEGKQPKKIIVVPKKIVNIVL
ncbi:MAG: leucine--tRNA ligase [Bacteroidetes bacterium]|nr:leucine--tRNA ligase [Bacteroidota bacterium]